MTIGEISAFLDSRAPLALQEPYDNAGLLLGDKNQEVTGMLICLDVTLDVIEEAKQRDLNLIIAHHPLIFKPIKRLSGNSNVEKILLQAIQARIGIYAIHTNLDNLEDGVSMALAKQLGLTKLRVLRPLGDTLKKLVTFCPPSHIADVRNALFAAGAGHIGQYDSCSFNLTGTGTFRGLEGADPFIGVVGQLHEESEVRFETVFPAWQQAAIIKALVQSHPYEEVAYDIYPLSNLNPSKGSGLIGEMSVPLPMGEFLPFVKKQIGIPVIRHTHCSLALIHKVALCGGAGSFLLPDAMAAGADAFLTGDLKYHDFFETRGEMLLADIGHYESEQFTLALLKDWLSRKFPNFAAHITGVITNPINYL